ncbi:MAG: helix-turn-helix domain-containing protein [Bacteroidota bacterium]
MLSTVLQSEMSRRNMSSHSVANEIGVSHTTVLRALNGDRIDLDTVIKLANWLHIRPSELLNSMSDTSLADQIAVLLSHSQELEEELRDAMERVQAGELDPAVVRDIVSYALYKLKTSGDTNVAANTTSGGSTRKE